MIILVCIKCDNVNLKANSQGRLFCERCNEEKELYSVKYLQLKEGTGRLEDGNAFKLIIDTIQSSVDAVLGKDIST